MSRDERPLVWLRCLAAVLFGLGVVTMLVVGAAALAIADDEPWRGTQRAGAAGSVVVVDRIGRPLGELVAPTPHPVVSERDMPAALVDTLVARRHLERSDGTDALRRLWWVLSGDGDGPARGAARTYLDATGGVWATEDGPLSGATDRMRRTLSLARIEIALSEGDLVTSYLNLASFGRGARGVSAAAETYFGSSVSQLSDVEAAYLADRLIETTDPSAAAGEPAPVHSQPARHGWTVTATTGDGELDATVAPILGWLASWLAERYGPAALAHSHLTVTLSIDLRAQQLALALATERATERATDTAETAGAPGDGGEVLVVDDTAGVRVLLGEPVVGLCDARRERDDATCWRLVLSVTDTRGVNPVVLERWPVATKRTEPSAPSAPAARSAPSALRWSITGPPELTERLRDELGRQLHLAVARGTSARAP